MNKENYGRRIDYNTIVRCKECGCSIFFITMGGEIICAHCRKVNGNGKVYEAEMEEKEIQRRMEKTIENWDEESKRNEKRHYY